MELIEFINQFKSLSINSLDEKAHPFSSYAPFVRFENKYYVYISQMAKHTQNLSNNKDASLFFLEDEKDCKNIFARKRVMLQVKANKIEKNSSYENTVLNKFEEKFDKEMINTLRSMSDFYLFEFIPFYGEAVFGFGKAYNIAGENLDQLEQRKNLSGHGKQETK